MKPHLQLKREPCEIGDDVTSASLPSDLEPVPCAKCEELRARIAALEKELEWWKAAAEMADDETYDPLP